MTAAHSYWSASKFESLMLCPGKIVLEDGAPDNTNVYAAEGTAAHQVLTWALQEDQPASAYIGRVIHLDERGKVSDTGTAFLFEVDQDMAEHVQTCVDYCMDLKGDDGVLFADIRVNYSSYLDVDHDTAWGTADVIVARGDELIVVDFKYGRGVEVDAERNPQMSLYGLGALQAYQGLCGDFKRIRMAISQPRVKSAPSEWDCTVEELEAWGRSTARSAVATCINASNLKGNAAGAVMDREWEETFLRPAEKACKFCKAKATCPALRDDLTKTTVGVVAATPDEFADLTTPEVNENTDQDWIEALVAKADLFEDLLKAARGELERRLLAGIPSKNFKLVQGKKGNRSWHKDADIESVLRAMRLKDDEMYDRKVIGPATAEKLAKAGAIGPRQWVKLQGHITQPDGKPHVAPESDPRPALDIRPVAEDFQNLADDLA